MMKIDIVANHVFIGHNVTTMKPQGPVNLKSGKLTIHHGVDVIIEGSFNVDLGAELLIETTNQQHR